MRDGTTREQKLLKAENAHRWRVGESNYLASDERAAAKGVRRLKFALSLRAQEIAGQTSIEKIGRLHEENREEGAEG